jgi:hypothetical protein
MYDISYISWNRMFYFGLGGLTSRACHLANFYQNVLNLVNGWEISHSIAIWRDLTCFWQTTNLRLQEVNVRYIVH